jgi:predicted RNase H-like HicB family nuclease
MQIWSAKRGEDVAPSTSNSRRRKKPSFTVRIYPDEDRYFVAYCKELPGCVSQGRNLEEAQENIREAMILYLVTLSALDSRGRVKERPRRERRPVRIAPFVLEPLPA